MFLHIGHAKVFHVHVHFPACLWFSWKRLSVVSVYICYLPIENEGKA